LLTYDAHYGAGVRADWVVQSLESLQRFVDGVVALHRQRMLTNEDLQSIRRQRITDAYMLLQRVAQGMSPADYAKISGGAGASTSAYATLLQEMNKAFTAYGPVKSPADMVDYAKALLLRSLGVEPNIELKTIANRYRQNRHRAEAS
jgi:hypothetical protein